jgi:exonuclease SbcC
MITGVKIRGYQSHQDTEFLLGPGLNVITGPSDSGKTAIIRAIRWVAFNEPAGDSYVNQAVGEAEVTLTLDSGIQITKRRRGKKTTYLVSTIPEPFEKAEVPDEVTKLLAITRQTFGDYETALNFAYQLDAPFLISETASTGAKILGTIAGTEVIDLALKGVSKEVYDAQNQRREAEKAIARLDEALKEYEDLDQVKEALDRADEALKWLEESASTHTRLAGLLQQYGVVTAQLDAVAQTLDKLSGVADLAADLANLEQAQQRYETLLGLYSRLDHLDCQIKDAIDVIARYGRLEPAYETLWSLETGVSTLATLDRLSTVYTGYTQDIERADRILSRTSTLQEAYPLVSATEASLARVERLTRLGSQAGNAQAMIDRAKLVLSKVKDTGKAQAIIADVEALEAQVSLLGTIKYHYNKVKTYVAVEGYEVDQAIKEIDQAKANLETLWSALEICPLCERPLKEGGRC